MTPEERAGQVVVAAGDHTTRFKMMDLIAAAIRAAVADERERCAARIERDPHGTLDGPRARRALDSIAAAIRAGRDERAVDLLNRHYAKKGA